MCERIDLGDGNFAIVCGGHRMRKKSAPAELHFPATNRQLKASRYKYFYSRPCKRCGVTIEFWQTPSKKWAPLERMKNDPENRIVSHFSTCPFANEFRKVDTQMDLFN
jgi:hypothetical protein